MLEIKGEIQKITIRAQEFNIFLLLWDKTCRKMTRIKIFKQHYQATRFKIYRTLHTFISITQGNSLTKVTHMLDNNNTSELNNFKGLKSYGIFLRPK